MNNARQPLLQRGIAAGLRQGLLWVVASPVNTLLFSVLLLHALLPIHSDLSTLALTSCLLAMIVAFKEPDFNRSPLEIICLSGFGVYLLVVLTTTVLHPETLTASLRAPLWGACIFTGYVLSKSHSEHDYSYFGGLVFMLVVSFCAGVFFWELFGEGARLWQGERLKLFAIHPSRLGLYCAAALFWCLHRCFESIPSRQSVYYLLGAFFVTFLLILTNTRTLILFVPIGLCCLLTTIPKKYIKKATLFFGIFLVGIASIIVLAKDIPAYNRLVSAVVNTTRDTTFLTRLPIWEAGWESFKEAPLLGYGLKSYKKLHASYLTVHTNEWNKKYPGGYEISVKHAHNIMLGRLVETGVLGSAGFFLFYLGSIACALGSRRKDRWIASLLVYYLCISMLDDPLFRVNDSFILLTAGAAIGLYRPARGKAIQ